jgi:hypothetical protein
MTGPLLPPPALIKTGKGKRSNSADRGYFVEQAEDLTGITYEKQAVRFAVDAADNAG